MKLNTLMVNKKKKINLLDYNFQDSEDTYFFNDLLTCRLNNVLVDLFLFHSY